VSVPELQHDSGIYQLKWEDEHIYIRVDRLHTERAGVYGELLIRSTAPGLPPHIHGPVHFNFISSNSRKQLIGLLNDVVTLDWFGILEQTCYKVVEAHRQGVDTVKLGDYQPPESSGMRVKPILQEHQATVFYGDGDSLKSFLATYISVLTQLGKAQNGLEPEPGNVLYLDYETDVDTFWDRVAMITTGLDSAFPNDIYYRQQIEPVVDDIAGIKKAVIDHHIDLIIIDSAAPATLQPENAEYVIPYFRALRSLGRTSLTIAHRTKSEKGDYPFGSTFWRNLPRSNFRIKADRQSDDVAVSLKHTKSNNGRRLQPLGFKFVFSDDSVVVEKAEVVDYPEIAGDASLKAHIHDVLQRGRLNVHAIHEGVNEAGKNVTFATIKSTLSQGKDQYDNQMGLWGLKYQPDDF
jgi:hypothetical protein